MHGSSPHTRGARPPASHWGALAGIIPAYAGSTGCSGLGSGLRPDHPRIRGEHQYSSTMIIARSGSSPHTRGARRPPTSPTELAGIIPAYAGSTARRKPQRKKEPDHPRIRGEHFQVYLERHYACGSSPHTRGARGTSRSKLTPRRIIPAYAGSTTSPSAPDSRAKDHPRIRGEHCRSSSRTGTS